VPSTVADVFAAAGLAPAGVVRWGTLVPETEPGNYVVALTNEPGSLEGALAHAPLDADRLAHLLDVRTELRLDARLPTVDELTARLQAFWLPEEVIVYAGLAGTSLRRRVGQYYKTPLGARRPHAGGWWLKTLSVLDELWVHYAATPDDAAAEVAMLQHFAAHISRATRERLYDSGNPAPFANLRTGRGDNKAHGITGATGDLDASPAKAARPASGTAIPPDPASGEVSATDAPGPPAAPPAGLPPALAAGGLGAAVSQNVTARDLESGRVRFPRPAKRLFPPDREYIPVVLRGRDFERVRWDPRIGLDQERSGMLAFGKGKLDGLVVVGDVLTVTVRVEGKVELR